MTNKSEILLAVLLLFSISLIAQTQFEDGYYIALDGSKIECLIRNSHWSDTPEKVVYKTSKEGNENSFNASQVRGFGIGENTTYMSLTADFPETYVNPNKNDNDPKPLLVKKTVFVKRILNGQASLYEYRGDNQHIFSFQTDGTEMEVLLYKKYVTLIDYKVRETNIFRRQLLKDLNCKNTGEIQKVKYNKRSLLDYFRNYNSCLNPSKEILGNEPVNKKIVVSMKIYGGIQLYDFKFRSLGVDLDFENKLSPKIGAELEGILPFDSNKWSIFLSADYSQYSSEIFSPNSNEIRYEMNVSRFGTLLGGKHYMFINSNNSFFIEMAMSFDKDFDSKVNEFFENQFFNDITYSVRKFNFGGTVGLGYSYSQKIFLKFNYYFDQNILEGFRTGNELSRMAVVIGCRL